MGGARERQGSRAIKMIATVYGFEWGLIAIGRDPKHLSVDQPSMPIFPPPPSCAQMLPTSAVCTHRTTTPTKSPLHPYLSPDTIQQTCCRAGVLACMVHAPACIPQTPATTLKTPFNGADMHTRTYLYQCPHRSMYGVNPANNAVHYRLPFSSVQSASSQHTQLSALPMHLCIKALTASQQLHGHPA